MDMQSQKEGNKKKFNYLICPSCKKLIANQGWCCSECSEFFEDMVFTDENYVDVGESNKYFYLDTEGRDSYKQLYFTDRDHGYILGSYIYDGKVTIEDPMPFCLKNGKIESGDFDFNGCGSVVIIYMIPKDCIKGKYQTRILLKHSVIEPNHACCVIAFL